MVDAGAHDGETERDVHGLAEAEELHRDRRLVVVHRDDACVAAVRADAERALRRDRPDDVDREAHLRERARTIPGAIARASSLPRRPPSPA